MTRPAAAPKTHAPNLDELSMLLADGSRSTIHPSDVKGPWQRFKLRIWVVLIAIYLAIPWIRINGHPAILIDIPKRQFFLFGATFNAQDFWMMVFVVLGVGLGLIIVSATYGRAWCGFGCPQTVFLEGVYRRIERLFDGNHVQRRALAASKWNLNKTLRRFGKWLTWLAISLVLSHTFLSYFMPIRTLLEAITSPPSVHPAAFTFILLATAIIYFNFAWFREQLCIVICPYGRLQSVLYDKDTVQVAYDDVRGEPRGRFSDKDRGACVDCKHCVAVCPTGIDIRNGTQLECVGCTNCIDACDAVMEKIGQPKGLVRFASQGEIHGEARRVIRPRTILYSIVWVVLLGAFITAVSTRKSFEAKLLRQQGTPITRVEGKVQNAFMLHVVNKAAEKKSFDIRITPIPGVEVTQPIPHVDLEGFGDVRTPIFARFEASEIDRNQQFEITIDDGEAPRTVRQELIGGKR
ncbi:MAG: cytochrome c oxidase accessory protein CcoG [Planctomycetes bacterium]|nr:cytochrome c oxidase accessory protein CcoG [Planctomycetota bacterium]